MATRDPRDTTPPGPAHSGSPDAAVGMERDRLHRLARSNPGVVHLGCLTGQLALYFDPPESGISRLEVTAVVGSSAGDAPPERTYHAVVRRVGRRGGGRRRRAFRHPTPALEWLYETVPDFDLLPTVRVNEPAGGGPEERRG